MKIAFVSAMGRHPWGGSEELWAGAALHLAADGHQVTACIQGWPQRHAKVAQLANAGVQLCERSPSPSNRYQALFQRVRRLASRSKGPQGFDSWLRTIQPDLVCVSNGGYMDGLPWMSYLADHGIPFVSIVQANAPHFWPNDAQLQTLTPVYQKARAVYCVSQANLRLLENQLAMRLPHAGVIWNPYQVPRNDPPPWPSSNDSWRLACVARLDPDAKGQDLLFEVLSRPEWRARPVTLSLFGAGDSAEGLRRLAELYDLGKTVEFRGQVNDIAGIWRENHALVLPSRFEGLPLALVEALICGRPAIVTDVAGNPEVVQDGITGFIASAPSTEQLAQAMERAWQARDSWQSMGAAARLHILDLVPQDPCRELANHLLKASGHAPSP